MLILYWLATHNTIDVGLAFGFGVAIAGVCAREGSRTMFYVRGDATKALLADLTYGVGLIVVVGALSYRAQLTPTNVLLATGIAALWPYLLRWTAIKKLKIERKVLRQFWACGRWALVGVAVTWINLSAYPLIVGLTLDNAAVADINVARLFLMPVGLCITAWSNLNRPKISKWAATGHIEDIRKLSTRSIYFGVAAIALLSATTTSVYPLLEKLIGTTYTGLLPMVLLWSLFFVFNLIRSMLMATLLINADGYKQLQKISWLALTISLSGLWFLSPFGSIWAVGVLVVVELIQCILIGAKTLKWWSTSIKANEL